MSLRERGLRELYADDPERADALVFGRRAGASRRGFLKGSGVSAMAAAVGAAIPFADCMPGGLIPAALAQTGAAPAPAGPEQAAEEPTLLRMEGKDGNLVVLGDRPLVAETPEHLLDDDITPTGRMYIRNNGTIPDPTPDPDAWTIAVDGEVNTPLRLSLGEIKAKFKPVSYVMQLECGGNGRSQFDPPARGNPWTNGGVCCPRWTGVPVGELLKAAGLKPSAIYTAHFGADQHLSGDPTKLALSRGVRLEKAMEPHSLLVWAVNGEPLPPVHGFPARLLYPGWSGSASHKWLTRIWIRDKEHDGQGMTGTSYRIPTKPIVPGSDSKGEGFRILESMPLRSIITSHKNGTRLDPGVRELNLQGHAWAGERKVEAVDLSYDFGQSWVGTKLSPPADPYAWQNWAATLKLPAEGYYEIWVRATADGRTQPYQAWNWNPQGYGANAIHRVAVLLS